MALKIEFIPKQNCPKCSGLGTYMYDHNHTTICNLCCPHNQGWWLLTKHYGENNGKLCCLGGCGAIKERSNNDHLIRKNENWILEA